jgi:hypothetical protein
MAIVDTTSKAPSIEPLSDAKKEKLEQQERENELKQELETLLKEEAPNEKLENALENYLLADPKRQITQLGGVEILIQEAEKSEIAGLSTVAASKYELAAKIEIYEQNTEETKKFLGLADQTLKDPSRHEIHRVLLSNLDQVMHISSDYYEKLNAAKQDEIPII